MHNLSLTCCLFFLFLSQVQLQGQVLGCMSKCKLWDCRVNNEMQSWELMEYTNNTEVDHSIGLRSAMWLGY